MRCLRNLQHVTDRQTRRLRLKLAIDPSSFSLDLDSKMRKLWVKTKTELPLSTRQQFPPSSHPRLPLRRKGDVMRGRQGRAAGQESSLVLVAKSVAWPSAGQSTATRHMVTRLTTASKQRFRSPKHSSACSRVPIAPRACGIQPSSGPFSSVSSPAVRTVPAHGNDWKGTS